jgi:hypothetical protein
MKATDKREQAEDAADELAAEYGFDYSQSRPNRFAGQIDKSRVVVLLDPDIAEVFTTPESVNAVLRALIKTMPVTRTGTQSKRRSQSQRKSAF